jgi:hypothetical protein
LNDVVHSFHDLLVYQRVKNDSRFSGWRGPARTQNVSAMWFIPELSKSKSNHLLSRAVAAVVIS